MVLVKLTPAEMRYAWFTGVRRQAQNLELGRENRWGASPEEGWDLAMLGVLGEAAVAKYTGIPWTGNVGNLGADDVGPYQVRTAKRHSDSLILHPPDENEKIFILVTGTGPVFHLVGWISGREGKKQDYWKDPQHTNRHAFFVPQHALHPMESLPKLLRRAA